MKSGFALFLVFSLLLVPNNLSYARKDLGDYWKKMMKSQPMPEAIKDLVQDPRVSDSGKGRFIRDFDIRPNIILYHTHAVSKHDQKQKLFAKNFVQEFHGTGSHG